MDFEACDEQADFFGIVIEKSDRPQTAAGVELVGDADPGASRSDQQNAVVAIGNSLPRNFALLKQAAGGPGRRGSEPHAR